MAKVINKTITTRLTDMKDGDVAEIVNWFCDDEMEPGTVVQRYKDALIIIGERSGSCYPNIFTVEDMHLVKCKVTILPPGSTIML